MPLPPSNPHDCALWLLDNLADISSTGDHWEGTLPSGLDFEATVQEVPAAILINASESARRIEFKPKAGHVFQSIAELLEGPNRRRLPSQVFTVRDLGYTHGHSPTVPQAIQNYLDVVDLWTKLTSFADYSNDRGTQLLFIQSYEAKLWLTPEYGADDLIELPGLRSFVRQYFEDEHHRDQKHNIVRSALLEIFKDHGQATLADLVKDFSDFVDRVKGAYALYTNDFSFERLKSEVHKQNQEDMLRLNKAFSDIQNQLLALPAALLLASSTLKPNSSWSNLAVLLGVALFSWFMRQLAMNQRNSLDAIEKEVRRRMDEVERQPEEIKVMVLDLFRDLERRLAKQKCLLWQVIGAVWLVFLFTVFSYVRLAGC